jgi:hypothetical protein
MGDRYWHGRRLRARLLGRGRHHRRRIRNRYIKVRNKVFMQGEDLVSSRSALNTELVLLASIDLNIILLNDTYI